MASAFQTQTEAKTFLDSLVDYLNDLHERRHHVEPSHQIRRPPPSAIDIVKTLPKSNCGKCGFKTCLAFASYLRLGVTRTDRCPYFAKPISISVKYPVLGSDGTVESVFTIEIDGDFPPARKGEDEGGNPDSRKNTPVSDSADKGLSLREVQVLKHLAQGATNPEISERLRISPHTVKSHVIHIFNKLNVDDRTQAAVWAVRNGII